MTSSNQPRGSKLRKPKPRCTPSDLADQFLDLQRLRKQIRELEQANERQVADAPADITGCQK